MANTTELDALLAWAEQEHAKSLLGVPSEWDQSTWARKEKNVDCGTACCLAGKAVARAGGLFIFDSNINTDISYKAVVPYKDGEVMVEDEAMALLDITERQAEALFWSGNTIFDLREIVEAIHNGDLYPDYRGNEDSGYDDEYDDESGW